MRLILLVGLRAFAIVGIHHDFYHLSQLKPYLGNIDPFLEGIEQLTAVEMDLLVLVSI
jgi:hypothetical protein